MQRIRTDTVPVPDVVTVKARDTPLLSAHPNDADIPDTLDAEHDADDGDTEK